MTKLDDVLGQHINGHNAGNDKIFFTLDGAKHQIKALIVDEVINKSNTIDLRSEEELKKLIEKL